jgi:hypothetical protein
MAQCRVANRGLRRFSRLFTGPPLPAPILACENFGRISAPRFPQAVQTKPGSMADSRTFPVGEDGLDVAVTQK